LANILTAAEAAAVLRTVDTDPAMLQLLPLVDSYIQGATGHDWASDTVMSNGAKAAARILITLWFEDPGMVGAHITTLSGGLQSVLSQLEAVAVVRTFRGIGGTGYCFLPGAEVGEVVAGVVGTYPVVADAHAMFEPVISWPDLILQLAPTNEALHYFRVRLQAPGAP